jgi:DNA-binding Lrp family transcriptional regulator
MARPKKLSDAEMIRIVETFFESHGNPKKMKCSLLEEYAGTLGIEIKAYDFRRSTAVRDRMEELKKSVKIEGTGAVVCKSIDIDAMLARNFTRDMLKHSLTELDDSYRRIYEKAVESSRENEMLLSESFTKNKTIKALASEKEILEARIRQMESASNAMLLENRYLRKMLKVYLYPAVANEILKEDNISGQSGSEVTQAAMDNMADIDSISSFTSSVAADRDMLSREESLLKRLKNQIEGGNGNA